MPRKINNAPDLITRPLHSNEQNLTSRYRQWYQSFETVKRSIAGTETMRIVQKGQVKYIGKGDVRAQNEFIHALFNVNVVA